MKVTTILVICIPVAFVSGLLIDRPVIISTLSENITLHQTIEFLDMIKDDQRNMIDRQSKLIDTLIEELKSIDRKKPSTVEAEPPDIKTTGA